MNRRRRQTLTAAMVVGILATIAAQIPAAAQGILPGLTAWREAQAVSPNTHAADLTQELARVTVPHDAVLNMSANLTLEYWAYHNNADRSLDGGVAKGNIFGAAGDVEYSIQQHNGSTFTRISADNNDRHDIWVDDIVDAVTWTHWAVTYDGSVMRLYKNAEEIGTNAVSITMLNTSDNFVIGARDQGAYSIDGYIDEVRVWNIARSQSELQANMSRELEGNESGLVGYWKLNESPDDETENELHGTEYNTTYTEDTPF